MTTHPRLHIDFLCLTCLIVLVYAAVGCGQKPPAPSAESHEGHDHAESEAGHDDHAHAEGEVGHDEHAHEEGEAGHDDHAHEEGEGGHDEHGHEATPPVSMAALLEQGVATAIAGPGALGDALELTGEITLDPDRMGHVAPRVPGVVQSVRGNLGEEVGRGQTMVVIYSRDLASAKSAYRAAASEEKIAKTRYERESKLRDKGITPEQDYLDAKQAYEIAQIGRELAESELHALGISESGIARLAEGHGTDDATMSIVAPIGGTILEKHVSVGEFVSEGQELFLLADLTQVWAQLTIPAGQLGQIKTGQQVAISDQSGHSAHGTLDFISALVEGPTRGAQARVRLANSAGAWRPGQFVAGRIALGGADAAIVVPLASIVMMENAPHVFVQDGDHFAEREVALGRQSATHVEILNGLLTGETYVAVGAFLVKAELQKSEAEHAH